MVSNLMDRSLYFKGLLILSKIDADVTWEEKEVLKIVGETLGFNTEFYDTTINEIIENEHIKNEPLKFSSQQIANMFLRDAIKLAFSDSILHKKEYEWILECARINKIPDHRINDQIKLALKDKKKSENVQLDVINYDWQSFFLPEVKILKSEATTP